MRIVLCAVLAAFVIGCNTYDVRPLAYDPHLKQVFVVKNPDVKVSNFLDVMEDNFESREIKVKYVDGPREVAADEYVVLYDAKRSWDFAPYLADATVKIRKDGVTVGHGHYHHVGRSCSLDVFTKWRGTDWKLKDLYDELLRSYGK